MTSLFYAARHHQSGAGSANRGVCGSGVDLVKFSYSPLKINAGSRRLLFSARLVREKNYEFLEAAKIIRSERDDVSFKVIGMVAKNPSSLNEEK
jgi:glycosyltransferase involved in cell wall biosynthesis